MSLKVRIVESVRDIAPEAWNALHTDADSPFVEWEWLAALESTGCATPQRGWTPQHITLWRDGLLVGAAPAYLKANSEGEFVFDHAWANAALRAGIDYYPKLLLAVPFTPATGPRVMTAPGENRADATMHIANAARAIVDRLALSSAHALFVDDAERARWVEQGWVDRYGVQFHWHNRGFESFEAFLATLPSKRRTAIRREVRQAEIDGTRVETLRGEQITENLVEPMFEFYTSTVDKFMWGRRYLTRAFFDRVFERFRHRLAWVVARDARGTPIAGAFNVERGAKAYGRYWGCTEERRFLHFHVCFYEGIRDAIARAHQVFEPGAGGEHKRPRGFEPTRTHSTHWIADDRLDRAVRHHLRLERAHVDDWLAAGTDGSRS